MLSNCSLLLIIIHLKVGIKCARRKEYTNWYTKTRKRDWWTLTETSRRICLWVKIRNAGSVKIIRKWYSDALVHELWKQNLDLRNFLEKWLVEKVLVVDGTNRTSRRARNVCQPFFRGDGDFEDGRRWSWGSYLRRKYGILTNSKNFFIILLIVSLSECSTARPISKSPEKPAKDRKMWI